MSVSVLNSRQTTIPYGVGMPEHEHIWSGVEYGRYTGTPHRRCLSYDCQMITLDLSDDEDEEE